jgi:hypothetical protein
MKFPQARPQQGEPGATGGGKNQYAGNMNTAGHSAHPASGGTNSAGQAKEDPPGAGISGIALNKTMGASNRRSIAMASLSRRSSTTARAATPAAGRPSLTSTVSSQAIRWRWPPEASSRPPAEGASIVAG